MLFIPTEVCAASSSLRSTAHRNQSRNLNETQPLPDWFCDFFGGMIDEERCQDSNTENNDNNSTVKCPAIFPLSNETGVFDMSNFTEKSWFVQKQQIDGFQTSVEDDFYCLVWTYTERENDNASFFDFDNYGTTGGVEGPQQEYDSGGTKWEQWCAGQDEFGGGLVRISPCLLRSFLVRTGFPQWVLAVAPDYSWAIVAGGEPDELQQTEPTPLCTTRTNVSKDVLADSSGSGLWLLTRDRMASNDTIAEMENVLLDMGVYTEKLLPVVHNGCTYKNATLRE